MPFSYCVVECAFRKGREVSRRDRFCSFCEREARGHLTRLLCSRSSLDDSSFYRIEKRRGASTVAVSQPYRTAAAVPLDGLRGERLSRRDPQI